ncbi:MAG: DUF4389 domain-containing protein [Pseudomonadota bacterium]|nr:DUF4389 domain-containing protein [Pseudomonadota bacterium]
MDNQIKENLSEPNIWTRLGYMVLYIIAYAVAETVFALVAIFQFLSALFTRQVNTPLATFAANLSWYIYQIVQFQTFNSEEKPFPFSDWPNKSPGQTPWSDEAEAAKDHETVTPPENNGVQGDQTSRPEP